MNEKSAPIVLIALVVLALAPATAGATGKAPGTQLEKRVDLLIDLAHPGGLKRFVRRVSDPSSRRYRDYRSVPHLIRRYGAKRSTRSRVLSWLQRRGIEGKLSRTRTWIIASAPADRIPRSLLHGAERRRAARGNAVRAGVPPTLRGDVLAVSALDRSAPAAAPPLARERTRAQARQRSSERQRTGTPQGCPEGVATGGFTPNQYTTAYGHAAMHARGYTGAGQRVALVEIDSFRRSDIGTWAECFGLEPPPIRRHKVAGRGFFETEGETALDLEVLTATAPDLDGIDVYLGDGGQSQLLVSTAAALGTKRNRPDVISISLGQCELQTNGQIGYVKAIDHVFAVAAGAGISTLVATGDQGSAPCTNNSGEVPLPVLAVNTPSSSNYVTAVGGTNLILDEDNSIQDEITWNDVPNQYAGSTGGYSLLSSRPWYQRGVHGGGGNVYGARTLPDVAGLADVAPGYAYYCSRSACRDHSGAAWFSLGGTSAATPLLAGGVALANQAAAERGQGNLGLINPLLYGIGKGPDAGSVFRDVTEGDNDTGVMIPPGQGGTGRLGCCDAKRGYDLATGWGSVDVAALSGAARRLAG